MDSLAVGKKVDRGTRSFTTCCPSSTISNAPLPPSRRLTLWKWRYARGSCKTPRGRAAGSLG